MQPSGCSSGARTVPGKTILTEDPRGCVDQFPPTAVQLILLQRCQKVQIYRKGIEKSYSRVDLPDAVARDRATVNRRCRRRGFWGGDQTESSLSLHRSLDPLASV